MYFLFYVCYIGFVIFTEIESFTKYRLLFTLFIIAVNVAAGMAQSGRETDFLDEYAQATSDSLRVETLIKLCDEFTYSQPEKALDYFAQARELSEKSGNNRGLARAHERAGNIYFHQGDKTLAREHYLEALKVNQQVGDYEISASIHYNLGNLHYETGAFDSVLYHADKAAEIFLEHNDSIGYAATRYLVIGLYKDQGKYSLAMKNGLEALGIFQRHHMQNWEMFTLNNIVDLYKIQGDYAQCLEMIDQVLENYRNTSNHKFEAVALRYKGDIYIEAGNYHEAETTLQQSLAIAKSGSFLPEQAKTLISLGMLASRLENHDTSKNYYRNALQLNLQTGDAFYEAVSYLGIGKALYHQDSMTAAVRNLLEAEERFKAFDDIAYLKDIYLYLSLVNEQLGNYQESLSSYKLYSRYSDSLLRAEKSMELGELTTRYETALKEEQIQLLRSEKEHVMKSRNNLVIIGLLLVVLAASVISFLVYRARKNKQLVEKKEEVDRMKSKFFSNISHEFRTPLTLILSPLYELKKEPGLRQHGILLSQIERNAKRLLSLINQILDLSKLEAGKYTLQVIREDLFSFLRRVASSYDSLAAQREIKFRVFIPREHFLYNYDPEKLEMIVNNLLTNAFRFEPDNGEVVLEAIQPVNGSPVRISVKNSGSHIPEAQLEHIFDRYYSDADGTSTGIGIGLALVKELVDLFRGTIQAQSTSGTGTAFIFEFPEHPVSAPEALSDLPDTAAASASKDQSEPAAVSDAETVSDDSAAVTDHEIVSDGADVSGIDAVSDPAAVSAPEAVSNPTGAQGTSGFTRNSEIYPGQQTMNENVPTAPELPTLLVIEDHPELCEFIRTTMSGTYRVTTAGDGRSGLEKAVSTIPDIILSDVMMPEMDGLDLCRQLKQNENTSHIPIILLSARAGEEGILEGLRAYADDYLVKPFRVDQLKQRMVNLLRTRNELRERYSKDLLYRHAPSSIQPAEKVFFQKLTDILEKNISNEEFGVSELSKEIGMSRSQLHRKLIGLLDMNASNFIRNYRLKRGRELLMNHAGSISEVAYMVGFNSPAYFTKCYREYFGVTPGEQIASV